MGKATKLERIPGDWNKTGLWGRGVIPEECKRDKIVPERVGSKRALERRGKAEGQSAKVKY